MSQEIRTKISDWWHLISAPETLETYKNFFVLTWKILKDTVILLGFLVLYVFVLADWVWSKGNNLGQEFKQWRAQIDTEPDGQWMAEAVKALTQSTKHLIEQTMSSAKAQLGVETGEGTSAPSTSLAAAPAPAATPSSSSSCYSGSSCCPGSGCECPASRGR